MKNIILIAIILLVSCSNQKEAEETRRIVELSIKRESQKANKIIADLNKYKVNGIDNSQELLKLYDIAFQNNAVCVKMLKNLQDIDSKINLKKEALDYFESSNGFLKNGLKPILTMSVEEIQSNKELALKAFTQGQQFMESTQKMSEQIILFCKEHNLNSELTDFDKSIFNERMKEVEKQLRN